MMRNADERVRVADDEVLDHLRTLAPAAGKRIDAFLDGLPRRYLRTQAASDVIRHMEMSSHLGEDSVQLDLTRGRHWYELTLVTRDRPFLFAKMAGALAAWGMNIVKASAFSNSAGVVADLERMLRDRLRAEKNVEPKVKIETRIEIDDSCSPHTTLIEVITQDRPGLLYRISSQFSHQNCNIEIALIETEGQMAIDVFYLTTAGDKLSPEHQARIRAALLQELATK